MDRKANRTGIFLASIRKFLKLRQGQAARTHLMPVSRTIERGSLWVADAVRPRVERVTGFLNARFRGGVWR